MTALDGSLYDYRADTPVRCPRDGCGWTGTFGELTDELRSFEIASYECPVCMAPVVIQKVPGRAEALMLPWIPKVLRTSRELPALELATPTRFVWDVILDEATRSAPTPITVITTADGRAVWREPSLSGGQGRVPVVRAMLRARYGSGFGGLALTARAEDWLAGDRRDVAQLLGDPPILAANPAASYEPITLLGIRIKCASGATYEDPSLVLLTDLLRERSPEDAYLILDRLDGSRAGPFAQAFAKDDGTWIVEYRDSQADPLFRAQTPDVDLVGTVLTEWSLRVPGWHERLAWAPFDLAAERAARALANPTADGTVVLWESRDDRGWQAIRARLGADGSLHIEGQDLGSVVEDAWGAGNTEYEWWWTVRPDDVPAAVAALGGDPGDDVLPLLARWSAANNGRDPGRQLRDAGIPVEFDNRVGD
jgi:hypothetical protein